MKMRLDARQRRLLEDLHRLDELVERGDVERARKLLFAVRESMRSQGRGHGFASWRLSILADNEGELVEAMNYVTEALEQDPLSQPFRRSFEIIAGRIRTVLTAPDRDPADPSTPELYELLVRFDAADEPSHLAMAAWSLRAGHPRKAHALAAAVTVLSPGSVDAWRLRAAAARELGLDDEARECEQESALRTAGEVGGGNGAIAAPALA